MSAQGVLWVTFCILAVGMLAFDLGVLSRRAHVPSTREAGILSATWVLVSLLFGAGIWSLRGHQAGLTFLAAYLLEKSLSIDNMFVFLVIFKACAVPPHLQPKVLKWGILGALVMRGAFIAAGAVLLHSFAWVTYVFGAVIIWTGMRMLATRHARKTAVGLPPLFGILRRRIPTTDTYSDETFTSRRGGVRVATPLLLALIAIEVADLVFAIDSIPAVFAVTADPFLVYTSNVFAILGLRALYFLLAGVMDLFRHLHTGLAVILMFVGVKMLVSGVYDVPITASLGIIASILVASVVGSLLSRDDRREPDVMPRA